MRNNAAYLAACAAMGAAFAASPLAAAEVAHRWSFNGDYSDSVGGANAVKGSTIHSSTRKRSRNNGVTSGARNSAKATCAFRRLPSTVSARAAG